MGPSTKALPLGEISDTGRASDEMAHGAGGSLTEMGHRKSWPPPKKKAAPRPNEPLTQQKLVLISPGFCGQILYI